MRQCPYLQALSAHFPVGLILVPPEGFPQKKPSGFGVAAFVRCVFVSSLSLRQGAAVSSTQTQRGFKWLSVSQSAQSSSLRVQWQSILQLNFQSKSNRVWSRAQAFISRSHRTQVRFQSSSFQSKQSSSCFHSAGTFLPSGILMGPMAKYIEPNRITHYTF